MSTPDPQQPSDPPPDAAQPAGAEESATERVSFDKPTTQLPEPQAGTSYDQPTAPTYGPQSAPPYDPLPGQRYDPQTGRPLDPPTPQGTAAYSPPPSTGSGPEYSGPEYSGPPYSGPQYSGPHYSGPHYSGPQYSGQQYSGSPYYGAQYYGGYPAAGYGAYPSFRPTNGMAIASLVLGILWLWWVGSILALVFGYVAQQQIRQRGESGGGMATAGIVLGWIGVATLAIPMFFVFVSAATPGPY